MEWCHTVVILRIKISHFWFEKFYKFKRWKLHQKMLNSPFFIKLTALIFFISDLIINITSHIKNKLNEFQKSILEFSKILKTFTLYVDFGVFIQNFTFFLFLFCPYKNMLILDHLFEIFDCFLCKCFYNE